MEKGRNNIYNNKENCFRDEYRFDFIFFYNDINSFG